MRSIQYQMILFLFLLVNVLSLFAVTNETINKPNPGYQTNREIGISITPVFSMDTINPQITVVSPNGGELWLLNTQRPVLWSATDSNFLSNPINITLSTDNGLNYTPIAEGVENSSSYLWTIPMASGPQSLIKIWAVDTFGNYGFDISDVVFNLPGTTVSVTPIFTMDTENPTVELLAPNGGEVWYVGDTNYITWSALDSNFSSSPITLEYKVDTSWIPIVAAYNNDGYYSWIIPNLLSAQAYVRISVVDLFGNAANDLSQSNFVIGDAIPAAPQNVGVQIFDSVSSLITWDRVTLTVQGNPVDPSGYIILANTTDNPMDIGSYYVLGTTEGETSYIHENALITQDRAFYRIIAVKNFKGLFLDTNKQNFHNTHISWNDLKKKLEQN